ncbi:MAG: GH116 family glycosyl-hydrolase [Clostridia bacterium]|nr:GH116 family glycosyl-hydrolase [Clostridia bacterium]
MEYKDEYTNKISFPIGGIGSGCIGLGGDGRLVDWEIFNRPSKGSINGYSHIAVKAKTNERIVTKILNSDMNENLMGQYGGRFGFGPDIHTMCALPHFKNHTFKGEFPIAELNFWDEKFPGRIKLTAFNPFIPLDDKNSSIPGAFFEVETENNTNEDIEYQISFTLTNPYECSKNFSANSGKYSMITLENAGVNKDDITYGDLTIATDAENVIKQTNWYRGRWRDSVTSFWNEFNSDCDMKDRVYDTNGCHDNASLVAKLYVKAGEKSSVRFIMTWNTPKTNNYWSETADKTPWKNYYATLFENSAISSKYSLDNWDMLKNRTLKFKNALFNSSLDETVKDAISATMSVLKSPTVLRLEDGSFYGWEGVNETGGSCEGTCQHVWNYSYALCFLFPQLERSIRNLEFKYSTAENGRMSFRLKLPPGTEDWKFRACLDGQMGTIIKSFREWKISGDDEWLKNNWNTLKSILEYAWSEENPDEWDRNKDGVLEGRQHHTLDMELFGPSSWLESMYLAALKAAREMALYLGDDLKAEEYGELFEKGYNWMKENLFNGEYFIQKIDISDKRIIDHFPDTDVYWNNETKEIKYQIGEGSEIDQMLGQWHCAINGLGDVFDKEQLNTALDYMMKHNYKESMREFVNLWRVYSLNDDAGTVMCDYSDNRKRPSIPIPYESETMHGFEYQFAGLLISEGRIEDGLKVIKAVRDRYDGRKRNPWNEMECGSNYARSMASFALLPILSGFEFHLPKKYIGFNPVICKDNFSCFWCVGTGWGTFTISDKKAEIKIEEGYLDLERIGVKFTDKVANIIIDGEKSEFEFDGDSVLFNNRRIKNNILIEI